ncbi:MAG: hypothetical protein JJU20_14275 [Opitutales bacterium]|nr:hypothetical protein [Opitutales bacterium]
MANVWMRVIEPKRALTSISLLIKPDFIKLKYSEEVWEVNGLRMINGGMMEWWNDGMVDWWIGGVVEWWNDGMVEWWIGGGL